jgi:hypothetical protein
MSEMRTSIESIEASIRAWPLQFSDLADGADIKNWAKKALKNYVPALAMGQEAAKVRIAAPLKSEERVTLTFPAFFDDNPSPSSQVGEKVKFSGKSRWGMVAFTEEKVMYLHESAGRLYMVAAVPLERVKAFNLLTFKFSLLSVTSAGPGFELIYTEKDGSVERAVFRTALTPKHDDDFENQVRAALGVSGPRR